MYTDTLMFLDALFQRCRTPYPYACLTLTAIHPDHRHPTPSRHIELRNRDRLVTALERLAEANRQGWGAYFAVGLRQPRLTRWQRGGVTDVVALPAFYIDIDAPTATTLARLRTDPMPPSIIVASGGGYHAYWLLDEPTTDLHQARQVLQGLAREFGGDRLSPAQSLRLPGTINTKPERGGALCHLVELTEQRYALADFQHFLTPALHPCASPSGRTTPLNPRLVDVITATLYHEYAARSQRRSAWLAAMCPCGHAHDAPGAHFFWNSTIGCGCCHGRHGTLRLTDLCSILGINAATYGGVYV